MATGQSLKFYKVTSLPTAATSLKGNIYFNDTDKTINICNGSSYSVYKGTDTDTNTWRGIVNNLTSTSTSDSLSAYQGKLLNDNKADNNHVYHYWGDAGREYYDACSQNSNLRIMTENQAYDTLRFRTSTLSDIQYYDTSSSAWTAWSPGSTFYNLFDGNQSTYCYIDHDHRKFRFCITVSSSWPTNATFLLHSSWCDWGTASGNTHVTIETRSSSSSDFTVRQDFDFTNWADGMNGYRCGNLHNGETLYRITISLHDWTKTSTSIPLSRICILSNYSGGLANPLVYDYLGRAKFPGDVYAGSNRCLVASDISGKENTSNKVTSLSSSSTDTQYPSAKCVYDIIGNVETLLASI